MKRAPVLRKYLTSCLSLLLQQDASCIRIYSINPGPACRDRFVKTPVDCVLYSLIVAKLFCLLSSSEGNASFNFKSVHSLKSEVSFPSKQGQFFYPMRWQKDITLKYERQTATLLTEQNGKAKPLSMDTHSTTKCEGRMNTSVIQTLHSTQRCVDFRNFWPLVISVLLS